MKTLFMLMFALSILSAAYQLRSSLDVMAHNQYERRYQLLDATKKQPDHLSSHLGLTPIELAKSDPYFVYAYKDAVFDGYRLGVWSSPEKTDSYRAAEWLLV